MKKMMHLGLSLLLLTALVMLAAPRGEINAAAAKVVITEGHYRLVSHSASGEPGNLTSSESTVSMDGNVVAYVSEATNLVIGDTNGFDDIYVTDLSSETVERVSVANNGAEANHISSNPLPSADGRYIAFASLASNLAGTDTNNAWDVFLVDRHTDTLVRVSEPYSEGSPDGGSYLLDFSSNGQYVLFASDATNLVSDDTNGDRDLFLFDRIAGTIQRLSAGTERINTFTACISGDGALVAFTSASDSLVPGDTNGVEDVFLLERSTGMVMMLSAASDGTPGNNESALKDLSDDGTRVLFLSYASNLVANDTNGKPDAFLYDTDSQTLSAITNTTIDGMVSNWSVPEGTALSADGRHLVYTYRNFGNSHIACFWDLRTRGFDCFGQGGTAFAGSISGDGQIVSFTGYGAIIHSLGSVGGQVYILDLNKYSLGAPYWMDHEDTNSDNVPDQMRWQGLIGVDTFTVELKDDSDNSVLQKLTYAVADVCDDSICAAAIEVSLPISRYKWHVVGTNEMGDGEWSEYDVFEVPPSATRLRSPGIDANVYGGRPTFRWYQDTDATSYMIEFSDPSDTLIGDWQKNPVCDPYCSYRIPNTMDLGSAYGDYDWRVRTITNGIAGPWSEMRTFTYTRLERTWQISPENGFTTVDTTPTFEWGEITGATMYLFQIRLPDDRLVGNYLVSDATYCTDGGSCVWDIDDGILEPGVTYKWHVRAKNGRNFGRWTAYRDISIISE